jgi:predicted 2-oxoglutarate/Fe(II)-dependent dioxygenase YbiX
MIKFTKNECEKIINFSNTIEKKHSSYYFSNTDKINYFVWNIYRNVDTEWIFNKIESFFTYKTGIKIKKPLDILHIHKYKEGDYFKKHKDNLYPTQIHNIGVCLNDDYVGGEFVLYEPDEVLPKKQGELYTFRSLRYHEVKEITNGERWSIICFLHIENIEINKNLI